jgi:hypothetical protein
VKPVACPVVQIDEVRIKAHLDEVVRSTVEKTLNALLDAEANRLCGARKYERSEGRKDTSAGRRMMRSLRMSVAQLRPSGNRRIQSGLIFSERDSDAEGEHGPRRRSFPALAPASTHTSRSNIARAEARCSLDAG